MEPLSRQDIKDRAARIRLALAELARRVDVGRQSLVGDRKTRRATLRSATIELVREELDLRDHLLRLHPVVRQPEVVTGEQRVA